MKKILLMLCCFIIASVSVSYAEYLAADFLANVAASEVEVDGIVQPGLTQVSTDGTMILLLDLTGVASGPHTFKARWHDGSGWWSDWSVPLGASKQGAPSLGIVDQ